MTIDDQIKDHLFHIRRSIDLIRHDLREKPVDTLVGSEDFSSRLDGIDARIEWIERHVDRELPF